MRGGGARFYSVPTPRIVRGLAGAQLGRAEEGSMPYIITEACIGVKDRACVDVCPVDCIYEGEDQLYIHP